MTCFQHSLTFSKSKVPSIYLSWLTSPILTTMHPPPPPKHTVTSGKLMTSALCLREQGVFVGKKIGLGTPKTAGKNCLGLEKIPTYLKMLNATRPYAPFSQSQHFFRAPIKVFLNHLLFILFSIYKLIIFFVTADRFARIINFDGGKLMVDR